jgi:hypothetical protein
MSGKPRELPAVPPAYFGLLKHSLLVPGIGLDPVYCLSCTFVYLTHIVKSQYFNTLGGKTNLAPSRTPKAYILLGARDPRNKVHPRLHQGIECNLTRSGISFCEHLNI